MRLSKVIIEEKNANSVILKTNRDTLHYLIGLYTFTVKNYYFSKAYKEGRWDGKIRYISLDGQMPRGLVYDLLKTLKEKNIEYEIDPKIVINTNIKDNKIDDLLSINLYDFQKEAVSKALDVNSGLLKLPTGSGKTMIGVAIANAYWKNGMKKQIIIAPKGTIVEQFYDTIITYSNYIRTDNVGVMYENNKEVEKDVLITTWQSLNSMLKTADKSLKILLLNRRLMIFDEAFYSQAKVISSVVKRFAYTYHRYGLAATYKYNDKPHLYTIKGLFGDFIYEKDIEELQKKDILSNYELDVILLKYQETPYIFNYDDYLDFIVKSEKRIHFIINFVKKLKSKTDKNILVLVRNIELGEVIYKKLKEKLKKVYFLKGDVKVSDRQYVKDILEKTNDNILVATTGVFGVGEDVKNIHYLVLTQARESELDVIQTIGRGLRKKEGKKLRIYDLADKIEYGAKHLRQRIKVYKEYGVKYNIKEITVE